jgi:Regulatory CLIP domain of proteinases
VLSKLNGNLVKFADICRTPGRQIGRCISIYECDYLLNILKSKSLTQQSIKFLQLSQCSNHHHEQNKSVVFVCCSENNHVESVGNLNKNENSAAFNDELQQQEIRVRTPNSNDSIIDDRNQPFDQTIHCGREKIENRIYSGQVRLNNTQYSYS